MSANPTHVDRDHVAAVDRTPVQPVPADQAPAYTAETLHKQNPTDAEAGAIRRKTSPSSASTVDEKAVAQARVAEDDVEVEERREARHTFYQKYRPFILGAVALVILGWWISSTILEATRHRW